MCLNPVPPAGFKWGGKGISSNCATGIVNVEQTGCLIQPWKMSTLGLAGNLNRKAMTKQFFCSPKSKARWFIISKKVSFKNQQTNTQSPAAVHRQWWLRAQPRQESDAVGFRRKQLSKGNTIVILIPSSIPGYKWRKCHQNIHRPSWRKVWFTLVSLIGNMKTMFQNNSTEDTRFVRNALFRHCKKTS